MHDEKINLSFFTYQDRYPQNINTFKYTNPNARTLKANLNTCLSRVQTINHSTLTVTFHTFIFRYTFVIHSIHHDPTF